MDYRLKISEERPNAWRMGADIANVISTFNRKSQSHFLEKVQQLDYLRVTITSKSDEKVETREQIAKGCKVVGSMHKHAKFTVERRK